MEAIDILHTHLMEECPFIHGKRLQAVMDVACSLQKKQNLSLTAIGKGLSGEKRKLSKPPRNDKAGSNHYRRLAREPWILATNLSKDDVNATQLPRLRISLLLIKSN